MHHTGKGRYCSFQFANFKFIATVISLYFLYRILKAQTRKYKLHKNVSLLSVAQRCPPNFTGADIYALCADAWFHAAKRSVSISATLLCHVGLFLALLC
jgi:peroxin-6